MNAKEENYKTVLKKLPFLLDKEVNLTANLSSVSALLKEVFDFFWVGFYIVDGERLIVGPYQGPLACLQIPYGKGVCGKSWELKEPIVVSDVQLFEGHISCNPDSRSEIVVPVLDINGEVAVVLDIDSNRLNGFDDVDSLYLEQIGKNIQPFL